MLSNDSDLYDVPCTHSILLSKGITPNPDYIKYKLSTNEAVYYRDHVDRQANADHDKLVELRRQNDLLLSSLHFASKEAAEAEMRAHMQRLHDYNELKDAGQALIGRLAVLRETTTRALYPEFGLELDD